MIFFLQFISLFFICLDAPPVELKHPTFKILCIVAAPLSLLVKMPAIFAVSPTDRVFCDHKSLAANLKCSILCITS